MQKLILILAVVLFSATAMAKPKVVERQPEDQIANCVYKIHGTTAHYALMHFRGFLESQYAFGLRNAEKDYNEAKGFIIQNKSSDNAIGFYAAVAIHLVNTIYQTEAKKDGHTALEKVLTILNCNKKVQL